jgi:hypothetical protein
MKTNDLDINAWQAVPARVAQLLPTAALARVAHEKAAVAAHILPVVVATWMPEANVITLWSKKPITEKQADSYRAHIGDYGVVRSVTTPDWGCEILLKRGTAIPGVKHVFETGNTLLGGPTPLSNGIVSALMLGGLGYGTGALAEQLFPERYLQRGKLRRTLGMTGAISGLGVGALNAYANARAMKTPYLKGLVTSNKTPVTYPFEKESYVYGYGFNPMDPMVPDAIGPHQPIISVPQFNNALWRDVNKGMMNPYVPVGMHTAPPVAAATSGMLTGLSTGLNSPTIRPSDVIRGFASAGVGLATANVAGRTLSAMAGLTPMAQNKLQDMGLWAGMLHAVVPPMFGQR